MAQRCAQQIKLNTIIATELGAPYVHEQRTNSLHALATVGFFYSQENFFLINALTSLNFFVIGLALDIL